MLPSRVVVASTRVWPGLRCPSGHCQWPSRATPNHVASHIVRARQDDKEVPNASQIHYTGIWPWLIVH